MDEQFVMRRPAGAFARVFYASTRWLGSVVDRLHVARGQRYRCVDVLARTMRDSALGG